MQRRSFLGFLSGLPFMGWLKPAEGGVPLVETWLGGVVEHSPADWYVSSAGPIVAQVEFDDGAERSFGLSFHDSPVVEVTVPPETKKVVVRSVCVWRNKYDKEWQCQVFGWIDDGPHQELESRVVTMPGDASLGGIPGGVV